MKIQSTLWSTTSPLFSGSSAKFHFVRFNRVGKFSFCSLRQLWLSSNLKPGTFDDRIPLRFENWSQQQQLLNHNWRRLQKENLPTLLKRTKWNFAEEPLKRGDVVWILKDRTPRGIWPLGRVTA